MTLRSPLTYCLLCMAALCAAMTGSVREAVAQDAGRDDSIIYAVKPGDTLIRLARAYFIRESDWKQVQRANRIADPRRLSVSRPLIIPVAILKFRPATATVAAFRGEATGGTPQAGLRPLALGQPLSEGARMATGPGSSLSLSLTDGSVITLPSNSSLRITRLRKLLITDSIDYDLMLENGAVRSRVTPFRNRDDRFRLRNPIAVSAVRGTDFRTRFDAQQSLAFAELIEGGLAVSEPTQAPETLLAPEFGAIVGRPGGIATEPLLPAPKLVSGGGIQRDATLAFAIEPVPGARSYRVQVARDSAFIDVVEDALAADTGFSLPSLPNGRYFARFTAFAASGLEGVPGTFAFKRRLNTTALNAGAGDDGFAFRWIGTGEGIKRYRFQLRAAGSPVFIIDEANLATTSLILGDLAPGSYAWRVGTTLFAEGEADTAWTEFESFTVNE